MDNEKKQIKRISVVIAAYNGGKYIEELIHSVLNQTYPVFEILVKDDGSTDDTCQKVLNLASEFPNIRLIKNPQNLGITQNFLSGFYEAKGDFIAYTDQDDIWEVSKVEKLLSAIGKGNMAFSNSAVCDEKGKFLYPLIQKRLFVSEIIAFLDLTIWGHQILFRKDILNGIDVDAYSRVSWLDAVIPMIAFKGNNKNVCFVDEMLIRWRRHSSSSSYNSYNEQSGTKDLGIVGVFDAVRALFDSTKIKKVRLFYSFFKDIEGISERTRNVLYLMGNCSFVNAIKAGLICLKDYEESYPGTLNLKEKLRLFFKPFFCVRNQSKGIEEINL